MLQELSLYDQKRLFQDISKGDTAAFRVVFDAYRVRLYAAILKITKSVYAAEEIVQEIFTSLWEGRSNLANVDNPPAYIFTVAYNRSFRYLKKVAADAQLHKTFISHVKTTQNDTEEQLGVKETRELIDHIINELPPQRKLIYKLSRESGLTHQQIASQLHISPLTVKKHIVLALRTIRDNLAKVAPVLALLFFLPPH